MAISKENQRLAALHALEILDTPAEPIFDRITAMARQLFAAPIALVSLVDADRQWFKSKQGLDACSTDRASAICAHAIELAPHGVFVVEDTHEDPRFQANPLVTGDPHIRFYAGAVLTTADGLNLGTLCVIDTVPRTLSGTEAESLKLLAAIVVDELELRRTNRLATEKHRLLQLAESMSGVGHWRLEVGTGKVTWSDEVYRIHGVTREDFDPNLDAAIDRYHPDDRSIVAAHLAGILAGRPSYGFQLRLMRPDGSLRQVVCKASSEPDADGKVVAVFGVFQDVTEKTDQLEALRSNEARYRLLAENATDIISRFSLHGVIEFISPAIELVLGHDPATLGGAQIIDMLHPDDAGEVVKTYKRLIDSRHATAGNPIQFRARHQLGHWVWLEGRPRVLIDPITGQPYAIQDVFRDITAAKKSEAELMAAVADAKRHAARAEHAEALSGVGHWRLDPATGGVDWSPQMFSIYGLDPAFPPTRVVIVGLVEPHSRIEVENRITQCMATGQAFDDMLIDIRRPDGERRHLQSTIAPERMADGDVCAVVGTVKDVTQRILSERAVAESEARYKLLAENGRDLVMLTGEDGLITYISPSVQRVLGYTPEELIGRSPTLWTVAEDAIGAAEQIGSLIKSEDPSCSCHFEFRAVHKDGREIWLEANPTLVTEPRTGAMLGITDVLRDISLRKETEVQLRKAQADAEAAANVKAQFLANMSHELRTPLTAVLGFSRLVEDQPELSETTRGYLSRVSSGGRALLSTINDILDFSKLEAQQVEIKPRPTSVGKMASDVVGLLSLGAHDKGLLLRAHGLENLPDQVSTDAERLQQVLLNLLGNAVKFTDAGEVRLDVCFDAQTQNMTFTVTDTGHGIPEHQMGRLFQRFSQVDGTSTRKHGGTGLGLAICKGLVEAMGGQIGVRGAPRGGACFWFVVPAPQVEPAARTQEEQMARLAPGCRVLLADDNKANRDLVRAILECVDAQISEAENGSDAVAAAKREPFDIILMDLRMPIMDGSTATELIRNGGGPNANIPILAFSADVTVLADSALFDGLIGKPIAATKLLSAIADAVVGQQIEETYDAA